jgi:hypothetical protein
VPHRYLSTFALASALLVSAYASAAVTDTSLPLNTWWDGAKPTANDRTWVNALFRDFSGADPLGNFEWIRNTIELQITTDSLTHGASAPVQGFGNLADGETVESLWLNFNPNLEIGKLAIYWTGIAMPPGPSGADTFPDAGLQPSMLLVGPQDFDQAGADGLFDVRIDFPALGPADTANSFSKLLLVYDGGRTNIDPSDFFFSSAPGNGSSGPFKAVALIRNIPDGDSGWIAAVPEPGTYAMLAAGLLSLLVLARSKRS